MNGTCRSIAETRVWGGIKCSNKQQTQKQKGKKQSSLLGKNSNAMGISNAKKTTDNRP